MDSAAPGRNRGCLEAENRELRALAARLFATQEDERRRLARALHDGAGGSITALRMAAHAALAEGDPAQRRIDLDEVLAQAGAALDQVRSVCAALRPPPLDAVGLEAALRWHAQALGDGADGRLRLQVGALPRRPAPEVEQACFRIAEEALSNAVRHSGAATVVLVLDADGGTLRLEVGDDGRGFAPDTVAGAGLVAMRERARAVGGRLEFASAPQAGTRVLALLPFD